MMKQFKLHVMVIAAFIMLMAVSCSKSPYDKAMDYLNELSEEVTSATDMETYDAVYDKIIELKSDPIVTGLTDKQKQEFTKEMASLTLEALAVKAILYEMPSDIKPTTKDIKELCKLCEERKANTIANIGGYTDVRAIIKEYYKIK